MANQAGDLALPVLPTSGGAPFMQALLDEYKSVITTNCAAAWDELSSNQPVVRRTFDRNPETGDFGPDELPALFLWHESIDYDREASGIYLRTHTLNLAWIPNRMAERLKVNRWNFWNAIDAAIRFASSVESFSRLNADGAWGLNLVDKLGLYKLDVGAGQPTEARIEVRTRIEPIDVYIWPITVQEELTPDPSLPPAVPNATNVKITTGGANPLLVVETTKNPV